VQGIEVQTPMRRNSHQPDGETELIQAVLPLKESECTNEDCPPRKLLKQFWGGRVDDESVQNRILRHLDRCPVCIRTLRDLRDSRTSMERAFLAVASLFIVAFLVWLWRPQGGATEIATVNLDNSELLRGVEGPPFSLPRSTKRLRILLSAQQGAGMYEVALLESPAGAPLIEAQGMAHVQNRNLELDIDFDVTKYPDGDYVLAIRSQASSWQYRPLRIK
jgi:hypothetical protein